MITLLIKKGSIVPALLLIGLLSQAQTNVLDNYIEQGLKNNIALLQKNIAVDKAMYALKSAQSLYQPSVDFQAGYQTGEGGRSISIPVGDLVNPVYTTLNQLTASNKFPQISNQESYFLPNSFTDAKLVTTIPIINKNLGYNKQIQEQQVKLQQTDVDTYKRELVKNIKTAYYNYLAAMQAIKIYESALQLAEEGKRTNEKLLANGKGLPAYVLRSESEVENARASLNDAQKQADNAKMYFNFLLNADKAHKIETGYDADQALLSAQTTDPGSTDKREELLMLQQSLGINQTVLKMNKDFASPKLNGFLNAGSQAEKFKFTGKSFYYLGGLQLEVPIFHGKNNQYKIKQTELDIKNVQSSLEQAKQQLSLSASVAANNLNSNITNYKSSLKQAEAAASYQRLIEKGYREGVNTFIETIDARTQLTHVQLLVNINKFKVLSAAAIAERENATYNLHP
jgi:outer membrane protein